jgi:hypothetical protein
MNMFVFKYVEKGLPTRTIEVKVLNTEVDSKGLLYRVQYKDFGDVLYAQGYLPKNPSRPEMVEFLGFDRRQVIGYSNKAKSKEVRHEYR